MKIILLSGGSGTRLWPLSNDSRAKQFLKVLQNEETGQLESMLQRTYRHILKIVSPEDVIIASNELQKEIIYKQLGNVRIIVEPERRDTFPAISLASIYCYSELGCSEDEVIIVVSVDTFVEKQFYTKIVQLEQLVKEKQVELALIGITPTYNSSKYGYLVPKFRQWDKDIMDVATFIEKPTELEALTLIEQSAYWNSGVFAFSVKLLIDKIQSLQLPTEFHNLKQVFKALPKRSFDYEMVEHLTNIKALTYSGYWKDLGTWNTLTEEMHQQTIGNAAMSDECNNTHIINELDLPVKVLGLSNIVVAVSADGILVSDKPSSSKMKDMLHEGLFENPMYEEKSWGWARTLDIIHKDQFEVTTKRIFVEQHKTLPAQAFFHIKTWTLVTGELSIEMNGIPQQLVAGQVIEIKEGAHYTVIAMKDTELIEVMLTKTT